MVSYSRTSSTSPSLLFWVLPDGWNGGAKRNSLVLAINWTALGVFRGMFIIALASGRPFFQWMGLRLGRSIDAHPVLMYVLPPLLTAVCLRYLTRHRGPLHRPFDWLVRESSGNLALAVTLVLWTTALISQIVDNVPLVTVFIPVIGAMSSFSGVSIAPLAWALAVGTGIGGMATPIGTASNMVALNILNKEKKRLSFSRFAKRSVPLTIIDLLIANIILLVRLQKYLLAEFSSRPFERFLSRSVSLVLSGTYAPVPSVISPPDKFLPHEWDRYGAKSLPSSAPSFQYLPKTERGLTVQSLEVSFLCRYLWLSLDQGLWDFYSRDHLRVNNIERFAVGTVFVGP